MRMRVIALAAAFAGAALMSGCGAKKGAPTPTEKKRNGGYVIGMSQCNLGEPWRVQMNADIREAAAKRPEIKRVIFKDAQNKTTVQQDQVREFINLGVDLIIISPKEALPLTKPVADAIDAGMPVIVLDRKVVGDKYTCFIGADNFKIGEEAGKFLVKLLGGKGNVVELKGLMTSTPAVERHEGFMKGIEGSELKIIFDADCHWLEPDAQREMASALARFPGKDDIQAVYAHNDPSAHGAYVAAADKGRADDIVFIGIDALPHEGIRYVREGLLTATFQYLTGGAEAIEAAVNILNRKVVPKNIVLGTRVFTKDNVDKGGEPL